MNILAAIKREERKLERELKKLQHRLGGVRAAGEALGRTTSRELTALRKTVKKRVLSAKGRANIVKATKKRWARVRAEARKAVS
jgi:hypothetical protein